MSQMKKLARLFLLCFMMLAIPLQGIAASAMQCCCAEHHKSPSADESKPSLDKEAAHAKHADTDKSTASEKCSSCANCCTGCASSATPSCGTPATSPASEKITSHFSSHNGHISDGLERPPRI
jgi:hypothetical protein